MTQLHEIRPRIKRIKAVRIGRGGKRGTYSGRGIKGQKARAGHRIRPAERDILKRIPKLRGYKFRSFRQKPAIVNLQDLEKIFKKGDTVSPESLLQKRLVRRFRGRTPMVKILGKGMLTSSLVFKGVLFSKTAKEKIKKNNSPDA